MNKTEMVRKEDLYDAIMPIVAEMAVNGQKKAAKKVLDAVMHVQAKDPAKVIQQACIYRSSTREQCCECEYSEAWRTEKGMIRVCKLSGEHPDEWGV